MPDLSTWLSDKQYDQAKWVALVVLPGLGTLYFAIAGIWGLPAAEQVVGTIVAVDAFLGILLGISNRQYSGSDAAADGFLTSNGVDEDTGHPNLQMTLTTAPEDLLNAKTVRLKVKPPIDEH